MLSLPSVSSTTSVVSRPFLVADAAVRPTSDVRAIEPTSAVSKERSKVDGRAPEGLLQSAQANPSAQVRLSSNRDDAVAYARSNAPETPVRARSEQPPTERSDIQKAMDTQIKELFSNVWKASAKAVDFLLGRPEPTPAQVAASAEPMSAILWSLTAPAGAKYSQAALTNVTPAPSTYTPATYTPLGGSSSDGAASRGKLLDVLA